MGPEPGARAAAAGLRASRADREQVIDLVKTAFVQGRLDRTDHHGSWSCEEAGVPGERGPRVSANVACGSSAEARPAITIT